MIRPNYRLDYAAYLQEGNWRCSLSPTGAHHWIVGRHDSVCKYCLLNNRPKPIAPAGTQLMPENAAIPTPP